MMRLIKQNTLTALFLCIGLLGLSGCGNGSGTTSSTTTASTAASLTLSASPTSVKSDNSTSSTITVTALDANNAAVPNTAVNLNSSTGILSLSSLTTGTNGQATAIFTSGTTSQANRTATITATSGGTTALIPIQIIGSTLTVANSGANTISTSGASPVTLTFTARDAGGNPAVGAAITVTSSGTGTVTITPVTSPAALTDASGQYIVTVAGSTTPGAVTITANAVGVSTTYALTVTGATTGFSISQTVLTPSGGTAQAPVLNPTAVSMHTGDSLAVTVTAPSPTTSVLFAATVGNWISSGTSTASVTVSASGLATANLIPSAAGLSNIQVIDANLANPPVTATLSVAVTAKTPNAITLQALPTVVPKSLGATTGSSNLVATVTDSNGQPVGGVPVSFSIINPTGGGEIVSPVIAFTTSQSSSILSLGQAAATFTSGSLSSAATGVHVRATVAGTTVSTNPTGTPPSGQDASIVIGGTAGSIAFSQATVVSKDSGNTNYVLQMSVTVTDSNGNPVPNTNVSLSLWPIAWSTGSGCAVDADSTTAGTFWNEDINENLVLDSGEDGTRVKWVTQPWTLTGALAGGTVDGKLTPPNSAAGSVPAVVTTDATGVANFNLTYPIASALWIIDRIRASTSVQGSAATSQLYMRLAPAISDAGTGTGCHLPPSPYIF